MQMLYVSRLLWNTLRPVSRSMLKVAVVCERQQPEETWALVNSRHKVPVGGRQTGINKCLFRFRWEIKGRQGDEET